MAFTFACVLLGFWNRALVVAQNVDDCENSELDPYGLAEFGVFHIDTLIDEKITQ